MRRNRAQLSVTNEIRGAEGMLGNAWYADLSWQILWNSKGDGKVHAITHSHIHPICSTKIRPDWFPARGSRTNCEPKKKIISNDPKTSPCYCSRAIGFKCVYGLLYFA
ncbi:hypothetical protein HNY73_010273 [Argiope bruennichi]|uniref:Uncharacterized protein n=1 Tax=Argiope bruennichi TaxID=94029 RepID=A0A8T0F1A8_ARGBR|nr:hypothetical protein HNY73_010273 [Argiope bruennichi]